jgi:integral membrane protein (TIGR01906 family)
MKKFSAPMAWLVALIIPLALIGAALRLLLLPPWLQIEYRMPYFPADEYGFSTQDRLHWSTFALNYLVNNSDISYLGDLHLDDGTALYNSRELSHMQDVKRVTRAVLQTWYAGLFILAVLAISAWRLDWLHAYVRALRRGAWLTIGIAILLGTLVAVGITMSPDLFWLFFTWFHGLFFQGDSWLFADSDTLIRLFPIRFWQDTFLAAALIVLAGGLGVALGLGARAAQKPDV